MNAYAPQAIHDLFDTIKARIPQAELGGIVGDQAHSFGYHLARNDLPPTDYSVQLPPDHLGDGGAASALDVTLPPDLMITCTNRLIAAAKARDPRLSALREFCGTTNGTNPHPFDLSKSFDDPNNTEGWDDSHLWHIHLSFYRVHANTYSILAPIADVFAGSTQEDLTIVDAATKTYLDQKFAALGGFIMGDAQKPDLTHPGQLVNIRNALNALTGKVGAGGSDPNAIAAAIADALPPDLAKQVVDELSKRIQP